MELYPLTRDVNTFLSRKREAVNPGYVDNYPGFKVRTNTFDLS
jgi:hypothetical protein